MESKQTLYNKYRPLSFAEVVNQNHIKITLQNEIANDKLAHAYLFNGPRGIGKTTIARILAKAVNCEARKKGEFEPCNKCQSCQEVDSGRSLAIIEIDAASQTKVDQTRENIIAASRVSASSGKVKIFIIDEVHMLSTASFNALLKTLEEPPAKVIFILATTEIHKVPETIISRCQRFDFHRLAVADLVKWMDNICSLERVEVSKDVLQAIAKQSAGGARDSLSTLGQVLTLSDKKINFDQASLILPRSDLKIISSLTDYLIKKQAPEAIDLFNKSLLEGVDLNQIVVDWIDYLRQLLLVKLSVNKDLSEIGIDKEVQKTAEQQIIEVSSESLVFMLDILLAKYEQIKFSSIAHLPIELGIIIICEHKDSENSKDDNNKKDESGGSNKNVKLPVSKTVDVVPPVLESTKEESPPLVKSSSKLKLDDIQPKWLDILIDLKEYNYSLSALMKVARPVSLEKGIITFAFQYSFHNEVLENLNNKSALEDIITKHVGEKIVVQSLVDVDYDKRSIWKIEIVNNKEAGEAEDGNLNEIKNNDIKVDVAAAFG